MAPVVTMKNQASPVFGHLNRCRDALMTAGLCPQQVSITYYESNSRSGVSKRNEAATLSDGPEEQIGDSSPQGLTMIR